MTEHGPNTLVITKLKGHILSALSDQKKILEMRIDPPADDSPRLNEIYIGKVSAVKEALHAAFIDVRPGVTCYFDLKELDRAIFTAKLSKKPIAVGDELLVQISREALKTKLPAVTANISFFSKNAILTTGRNTVGISSKLSAEKRKELQELVRPYICEDYGFVIRTNAGQMEEKALILEIERLINEYNSLMPYVKTRKCYSLIRHADYEYEVFLRDCGNDSLKEIVTDDTELYEAVHNYLKQHMPACVDRLRLYRDPLLPLSKCYALEQVLKDSIKEQVWLRSGAYLVIQPTEAMTVIDVNSGKADTQKKKEQFLKINLEAAEEIARQIRLRNISGIIVVDFINQESEEERAQITDMLKARFKNDPVPTSYIDTTGLQLVEITRKKVRKPLRDYIYILKEN